MKSRLTADKFHELGRLAKELLGQDVDQSNVDQIYILMKDYIKDGKTYEYVVKDGVKIDFLADITRYVDGLES